MVFEIRHYVPAEGKADALAKRFANHVFPLIERHGLTLHDYWETTDGRREIWYVMAWENEESITEGWNRFRDDPDWKAAKETSETDGPLVATSRSIILRRPGYYRP